MGAGNNYRLQDDRDIPMYYIEPGCDCTEASACFCMENLAHCIKASLSELKAYDRSLERYGKEMSYNLELKSTYHGDALLIDLNMTDFAQDIPIVHTNLLKVYNSIIRHLNKSFLIVQGQGWTSSTYRLNEFK